MAGEDIYLDPQYVRFYRWSRRDDEEGLLFYRRLAADWGGPVLDVACGDGRISLALARDDHRVVGLDISPAMLAAAREKSLREPPEVADRISFVEGDMREFDLGRTFPLVIVPRDSLFHISGRLMLKQTFQTLYRHTRPGGLAVCDVVAPEVMANPRFDKRVKVREEVNPETGLLTRQYRRQSGVAWDTRTVRMEHVFVEANGDEERKYAFLESCRWLEKEEGIELLRAAGFPEVEALGDYDGSEYTPASPRLILKAHRLEREAW